jgi:hypothetical protein
MKALCEESTKGFPNRVVLVTTMWGIMRTRELAESRERELQNYWDSLPWAKDSAVSRVIRFDASPESAESIISTLMESPHGPTSRLRSVLLISKLVGIPAALSPLASLQDAEAQSMVDFLNNASLVTCYSILEPDRALCSKILDDPDILTPDERRHALLLLSKLAKSAQIFPRCFELVGVECNLNRVPFTEGGFGWIYKGSFESQVICVKAARVTEAQGMSLKALRECPYSTVY